MSQEHEDKFDKRVRFVAKHYRDGAFRTDKAWATFLETHTIKRRLPLARYWQAIAAVCLLLITVGIWYMAQSNDPEWIRVATFAGQAKDVYLPDGTLVSMAENSLVIYDVNTYGKGKREVEMKGKAFFQVSREIGSPFSVKSTSTITTVLGTRFQIEEKGSDTELYVASGKVSFTSKEEEAGLVLTAGMTALYTKEKKQLERIEKKNENALSWKTKQLIFDETPLEEVIEDLSRHYQVSVENRAEVKGKKLTASFRDLPLEEVLLVINQTLDAHLAVKPGN